MSVIVVGDGLAGTLTAARLAERGVAVRMVSSRTGATALHGGGWYLGLERLPGFGLPASGIGPALDFVCAGLGELDLRDGPFAVRDVDGTDRLIDLAPATHAAAAELPADARVVDFTGIGHPFAQMHPLDSLAVPWPAGVQDFGRSFAAVAAKVEQEAVWHGMLKAFEGIGPVSGLLLPPVLGLQNVERRRAELSAVVGAPVAEALDTLPSSPGLRLRGALGRWLDRLQVERITARVDRIDDTAVHLADGRALAYDGLVLATGRFLTGGLRSTAGVREPLAGLRIEPELPRNLGLATNNRGPYGNGLFRAGVGVDQHLRPTRPDGTPRHARMHVVGDLLAGPDPTADRCGSGLAMLSAWVVAERLAGQIVGGLK